MVRKLFGTFAVAALLCASVVMADEVKGKIVKVDPDKKVITIKDGDKETEYTVADDCKMPQNRMGRGKGGGGGGESKDMTLKDLAKRLEFAKDKGLPGSVSVEKKGSKETVTEIKLERGQRPGKGDKDKTDKDKTDK